MFTGKLFKEQKEAAQLLCARKRALLAWEQGTGKSVISVAAIERLKELGVVKKPLVITLSGITWQWQEMFKEFSDGKTSVVSAKNESSRLYAPNEGVTTILSWELLRKDYKKVINAGYDLVCGDEIQVASNHKSKTSQILKEWNRENPPEYRWGLTGTIISNKLEDLYAVFYWIDRFFLPDWNTFEDLHIIRRNKAIAKYKNIKPLHTHLRKRMDRKTHKDLEGKLPALVSQTHVIDKSDEYISSEKILLDALNSYADNVTISTRAFDSDLAKALHQARQSLSGGTKRLYAKRIISDILDENKENKVVVFCFYKEPLHELEAEMGISGICGNAVFFTGDQDDRAKQLAIESFKGNSRVLLASNAGSTGLDLPMANHLVSLDVPFSYRLFDQRRKRITRAGSAFKTAVAHTIIMEYSIEHYYYEKVLNKGKLNSAVTEGTDDDIIISSKSLRQWILGHT